MPRARKLVADRRFAADYHISDVVEMLARDSRQTPERLDVWDRLPSMSYGTRLRLLFADGSEIEGRLVRATSDMVVLERNSVRKGRFDPSSGMSLRDPLTFMRADVSSVKEIKGWPFWAKAVVWTVVVWATIGAILSANGVLES